MSFIMPVWVAIALWLPGWGALGLSYQETHTSYVVFSEQRIPHPNGGNYGGMACRHGWTAIVNETFRLACSALPDRTAIIFIDAWPPDEPRAAYLIRHEMEHFRLGPSGPSWDVWREAEAHASGCAVSYIDGFCG